MIDESSLVPVYRSPEATLCADCAHDLRLGAALVRLARVLVPPGTRECDFCAVIVGAPSNGVADDARDETTEGDANGAS